MLDAMNTQSVAGLSLTPASLEETLDYLSKRSDEDAGRSLHLVNSYSAVLADQDQRYAAALADDRALLLADGTPLVWLSRFGRDSDVVGVRGPTLMRRALVEGAVTGKRHFLLGSTEENLALLEQRIAAEDGGGLSGYYSPPYGPIDGDEWAKIVGMIRESRADVVWVGLGTPLQDYVSVKLAKETNASIVAVGAAFDFLAGTKREAPRWLHGTGLEWLFRLVTEPRRLWRRYLVGNLQFLRLAIRRARARPTASV
jgi:N-acetylglucosaminyldiphosphoundecaprenol N-acetyl-beta-D-mannosaminyltransferase